ncbi:MAG TPA: hypothetical protein EYN18_01645 [Nitrospirales bacterium]|nr:hypothetical protein [Nitrospirales bacterium]HIN32332.1 hypothetical protein [Nitrospirales bacterium]HIO21087.1 hypothetical protein [Nitrospirales bacterium]
MKSTTRPKSNPTQKKTHDTSSGLAGGDAGFSLVELMIASTIGIVIIGAGFAFYLSMQRSLIIEEKANVMQQNVRGAMSAVVNIIRRSGYDPAKAGFDAFDDPVSSTSLQVYADLDGDGDTNDTNEDVTISFDAVKDTLQIIRLGRPPITFSDIDSGTFTYYDSTNAPTTRFSDVRVVEVAITGKTSDGSKTRPIVSRVRPWNLNLL